MQMMNIIPLSYWNFLRSERNNRKTEISLENVRFTHLLGANVTVLFIYSACFYYFFFALLSTATENRPDSISAYREINDHKPAAEVQTQNLNC